MGTFIRIDAHYGPIAKHGVPHPLALGHQHIILTFRHPPNAALHILPRLLD